MNASRMLGGIIMIAGPDPLPDIWPLGVLLRLAFMALVCCGKWYVEWYLCKCGMKSNSSGTFVVVALDMLCWRL